MAFFKKSVNMTDSCKKLTYKSPLDFACDITKRALESKLSLEDTAEVVMLSWIAFNDYKDELRWINS